MKNIFLRLYLALFFSLAGIAIGLDYIYVQAQTGENADADVIALWRAATRPDAGTGVIELAQLQWPETQKQQLLQQGALVLADHKGQRFFYGLHNTGPKHPTQVLVWPMPEPAETSHALWLLAFYGTLAAVIFIWLRPLVRDIDQLQQAVRSNQSPSADFAASLHQRSALTPVAEAFKHLQIRTVELMDLQRDIANAVSHDIRTPLARIRPCSPASAVISTISKSSAMRRCATRSSSTAHRFCSAWIWIY